MKDIIWHVRSFISMNMLGLAVKLLPDPYIRLWVKRGLSVAGEGLRGEVTGQRHVKSLTVSFATHGLTIPGDDGSASFLDGRDLECKTL